MQKKKMRCFIILFICFFLVNMAGCSQEKTTHIDYYTESRLSHMSTEEFLNLAEENKAQSQRDHFFVNISTLIKERIADKKGENRYGEHLIVSVPFPEEEENEEIITTIIENTLSPKLEQADICKLIVRTEMTKNKEGEEVTSKAVYPIMPDEYDKYNLE